jgi:predicted cobalt transporter CbtA
MGRPETAWRSGRDFCCPEGIGAVVGKLLTRGMLVGLLAGLLSFGFLKIVGEPQVDRAIAFESAMDEAKAQAKAAEAKAKGVALPKEEPEPELVSREVQASFGLLTGVMVYSTAFGGLFALVFAMAYGRMGDFSPRATSALLAAAGLVAVYIFPSLKYPANPPSVGLADTIAMRTSLYFVMILISLAAMIAAGMLRLRLNPRFGGWNAALIAAASYIAVMVGVSLALPGVNEVPEAFPATLLWQFRIASLGAQLIMWAVLGFAFGAWVQRAAIAGNGLRLKPAAS